ncbi:MAG: alpha/beta hydrolase, partial [Pseudomonadales bacterium]|nr:alpha/beta hydrolase [Pseudomonadales bacterium]
YLVSQSGVDASRMGVGGASCGGMISADLAVRRANAVRALMLLSSPPSSNAIQNVAENGKLAVFAAATNQDPITRGVAVTLETMVSGSRNPNSVVRVLVGTEHGLPMFSSDPTLRTELLNWLKAQLLRE